MPLDQSLVGRAFPPTEPYPVTAGKLREFAEATGAVYRPGDPAPATFPIVVAFAAMNDFLADQQLDLFRIVHGEQRFGYERPVREGDVLTASLTVASLRSLGGADIVGTSSEIRDAAGELVCTARSTLIYTAAAA